MVQQLKVRHNIEYNQIVINFRLNNIEIIKLLFPHKKNFIEILITHLKKGERIFLSPFFMPVQ